MYQQFMKGELTLLYHTCSLYLTQIRFHHFFYHAIPFIKEDTHIFFFQFDNRSHLFTIFLTHYFPIPVPNTSAWLWNRTVQNPYNQKHAKWNGRMQVTIIYTQSTHFLGESN